MIICTCCFSWIKGPENPTRQLLPIMNTKSCSGDGEGRKDKGCGGGSRSKTKLCVTKLYVKDGVWQRKMVCVCGPSAQMKNFLLVVPCFCCWFNKIFLPFTQGAQVWLWFLCQRRRPEVTVISKGDVPLTYLLQISFFMSIFCNGTWLTQEPPSRFSVASGPSSELRF